MDKLTIEDINSIIEDYSQGGTDAELIVELAQQLLDTMRENERLQERIKELNWEVEKQLSRQSMTISSYADDQSYKPTVMPPQDEQRMNGFLNIPEHLAQRANEESIRLSQKAQCNHYWRRMGETEYCEDCGISIDDLPSKT